MALPSSDDEANAFLLSAAQAVLGVALLTPHGKISAANSALCRMLGQAEESLLGASWSELVSGGGDERPPAGQPPAEQIPPPARCRATRPDGAAAWLDVTLTPQLEKDGGVHHLLLQAVDATPLVHAQEALRECSARIRTVTDLSPAPIVSSDRDGVITERNPAARQLFGYAAAQAIGRPLATILPEGLPEAPLIPSSAEGSAGTGADARQCTARRHDGSEVAVEACSAGWTWAGRPFATTIFRDTSSRHRAEAALRESEERYRFLADNVADIIWVLDLATLRYTYISPSVERLCGYTVDEALALSAAQTMTQASFATVFRSIQQSLDLLANGELPEASELLDVDLVSKDGSILPTEATARFLFNEQGQPSRVLGVSRDVTARRQAELALRESRAQLQDTAARLRATLDSMLDPHIVFSAVRDDAGEIVDFVIVDANPAAGAFNGVPYEQLLGTHVVEQHPEFEASEAMANLKQVVETGEPMVLDDVESPIDEPGVPARRLDVRVVKLGDGASETIRDVSDRYATARAIRQRVAELDALQRLATLLVQRVDLDTALTSVCELLATLFGGRSVRVRLLADESGGESREYVVGSAGPCGGDCSSEAGAISSALSSLAPIAETGAHGCRLLAVPLVAHDEPYGVLAIVRDAAEPAFTPGEQAVALTAADLLAAVARSERLHAVETQQAAVQERQRLARDLHDSVTQSIYSANLLIEALPTLWARDPEKALPELLLVRNLVRAALAELRILLFELRPETLAVDSLQTLLQRLSDAVAGRSEVAVEFAVEEDLALPEAVRTVFYRVAQEAINNIAKHARASRITFTLGRDNEDVLLTVRDDGCGFDPATQPQGVGQMIMAERAANIAATLDIASSPGAGTTVTLRWRDAETGAR